MRGQEEGNRSDLRLFGSNASLSADQHCVQPAGEKNEPLDQKEVTRTGEN